MSGKRGKRRRVSRRERSRQLLDLALELINERGYGAVTMSALAREAGVGKPIVYRSFPNRSAVILALLRREQKRIDRVLDEAVPAEPGDAHPRELLVGVIAQILAAVERNPGGWRLLLVPPEGTPKLVHEVLARRRAQLVERARNLVEWGAPYLASNVPQDLDVLARLLVSVVETQARIMLAEPEGGRERLIAAAERLLGAIAWEPPGRGGPPS